MENPEYGRYSMNISPRYYFYVSNGQIVKNIHELPDTIDRLDPYVFSHHVNNFKNDFAKWIYEVFREDELSGKLGEVKSKDETIRVLKAYLKQKENLENNKPAGYDESLKNIKMDAHDYVSAAEAAAVEKKPAGIKADTQPLQAPDKNKQQIETKVYVWKTTESMPLVYKKPENKTVNKNEPVTANIQQPPKALPKPVIPPSPEIKLPPPILKESKPQQEIKPPEVKPEIKTNAFIKEPEKIIQEPIQNKPVEEPPKIAERPVFTEFHKVEEKPIIIPPMSSKMPESTPGINKIGPANEDIQKINDADVFFQKNPVLMSQFVDARKKTLNIEPLSPPDIRSANNPEQVTEMFKDIYAKMYQRMSFLRKSGFDTTLTELMLFRIPPKIRVYETSKEKKEELAIMRYINEVIEELNNMKV